MPSNKAERLAQSARGPDSHAPSHEGTLSVTFVVPLRVQGPNQREHHMARKRRVEGERAAVCGSALVQLGPAWQGRVPLPCTVTLTRVGKRFLDGDNLQGACKAIRDQVAALLGCGDGPADPITWHYSQRTGDRYCVEVRIASTSGAPCR